MQKASSESLSRVRWRSVGRGLLLAWFVYHSAALLQCLVPSGSTLSRKLVPLFHDYLIATGNWQNWNMFETVPYHHDFDASLIVVDAEGKTNRLGPILPGFRPVSAWSIRHHTILNRLTGNYASYLDPYLRAALEAAGESAGAAESVQLELRIERLQGLATIRRSGNMSRSEVRVKGPARAQQ